MHSKDAQNIYVFLTAHAFDTHYPTLTMAIDPDDFTSDQSRPIGHSPLQC